MVGELEQSLPGREVNMLFDLDPDCSGPNSMSGNQHRRRTGKRVQDVTSTSIVQDKLLQQSDRLLVRVDWPPTLTRNAPDVPPTERLSRLPLPGQDNHLILVPDPLPEPGKGFVPSDDTFDVKPSRSKSSLHLSELRPPAEDGTPSIRSQKSKRLSSSPTTELGSFIPNARSMSELTSSVHLVESVWGVREDKVEAFIFHLRQEDL